MTVPITNGSRRSAGGLATRPKIAVVGTGAAGLGVLTALLEGAADVRITVFDIAKSAPRRVPNPPSCPEAIAEFYAGIYREIRALHRFKFPPPKTHFAELLPKAAVGKGRSIFRSNTLGGLTNYWGGTALPFTARELATWPIDAADLVPYYDRISEIIGISGQHDGLNKYFSTDFCNRPPLRLTHLGKRLTQSVNSAECDESFDVFSGVNRCTLETRESHAKQCVYCGECMTGCFAGSIYSTESTITKYLEDPRVAEFVRGEVLLVDPHSRSIRYKTENGIEVARGFDKVFLCAGCPSSTEIVMRSAGLSAVADMADNAVYVFPILYLGRGRPSDREKEYLSLSNLIFACVPRDDNLRFAQAQIYPNFDYLWRYNIPPRLWPVFRPLVAYFRRRVFWARLYVDGGQSQAYRIQRDHGKFHYEVARNAEGETIGRLMTSIRKAVNRNGFWIPPLRPLLQKANSHYAATLPYGNGNLDVSSSGEIFPGVHLCDSACFPDLPAVSLTFTIMANAMRSATEAMELAATPSRATQQAVFAQATRNNRVDEL